MVYSSLITVSCNNDPMVGPLAGVSVHSGPVSRLTIGNQIITSVCPPRPATVCNVCCLNGGFRNPPSTKTQYTCSKLYSAKFTFIVIVNCHSFLHSQVFRCRQCREQRRKRQRVREIQDTSHLHTAPGLLLCEGGSVHQSTRPRPDDGCNSYYDSGPDLCLASGHSSELTLPTFTLSTTELLLSSYTRRQEGVRNSHATRNQYLGMFKLSTRTLPNPRFPGG